MALTDKKQRFVEEYCVDWNGTQAAIRAGYSPTSAKFTARDLLQDDEVRDAVAARMQELHRRTEITAERVLREIAAVAFSDPRKLYGADGELKPVHLLDDETAASIASIEIDQIYQGVGESRKAIAQTVKIRRFDKGRALEQLAKHLELYVERSPNGDDDRPSVISSEPMSPDEWERKYTKH